MQVTGMNKVTFKYKNSIDAIRCIIGQEGVRGLYKGRELTPSTCA